MTDQQLIELLAQREGWTSVPVGTAREFYTGKPAESPYWIDPDRNRENDGELPNYLHDLNALQPILATLTEEEWASLHCEIILFHKMKLRYLDITKFCLTLKPSQLARCIGKAIGKGE